LGFNSYIFILLFLPLSVLGYFNLNKVNNKYARIFLVIMSLWFYGYFNYSYLLLILASIIINFFIGSKLSGMTNNSGSKKILLFIGVLFNVLLIGYFKYYDFFVSNINLIFKSDFNLKNILLPLGISFFTFQQISYIVDSYHGETKGYDFIEYALFVTYFPQLVAGPIVLHSEMIPQFRNEKLWKINYDNLCRGFMLFTFGLSKKMLIADKFGLAVDAGFVDVHYIGSGDMWIMMLAYTIQLYFDFSGYSDMATGIGLMFNFEIPMNFNSPLRATSITNFWTRWHMTLMRFLRNYIYFPLGGSRKNTLRTYVNIMIVFLISGIWHGANYTFILWGVLHGIISITERFLSGVFGINKINREHNSCAFGNEDAIINNEANDTNNCVNNNSLKNNSSFSIFKSKPYLAIRMVMTYFFVSMLFFLFRSNTVSDWLYMAREMFTEWELKTTRNVLTGFNVPGFHKIMSSLGILNPVINGERVTCLLYFIFAWILIFLFKNNYTGFTKMREGDTTYKYFMAASCVMMLICIMSLGNVSTFLYFNF